jgi:D-alanine-D-alanine ligase
MKIRKHIVIVRTSIKQLSSMSQVSCDALVALLSKHYEKVSVHIVNNLDDLKSLVSLKPDVVFLGMPVIPLVEGLKLNNSSDIWLSQYLDENEIVYTGSVAFAHKLERNKALAKQKVLDAGLDSSAYFVARQKTSVKESSIKLNFPMFVKPLDRGGGLGIDSQSVVHNFAELESKISAIATDLGSDSLVEEYLDGREFSVAILRDKYSEDYHAMPLELIAPKDESGSRLLSNNVKINDTEKFALVKDTVLNLRLSELATDIFIAIGARDYGRIDIRLDASGVPQFLEANLIPSIIEDYGNFPKACLLNKNLSYEKIILQIVDLAFARDVPDDSFVYNAIPVNASK